VIQPGGAGSSPVVTIMFRQFGVKLEFTPVVNDDGSIRLTVAPEVSSLDYTNSVTIGGFTVPALSTRKAETQVELRSDQSFAISGLLDQRTTDLLSKTPGVANIPILGALFKSKNINHSTSELMVIVTPTLVDPLTEAAVPSQPDFPIPTLNVESFDKSLGKNGKAQPSTTPANSEPTDRSKAVPTDSTISPATPSAKDGAGQEQTPVQSPESGTTYSLTNPATVTSLLAKTTNTYTVTNTSAFSNKPEQSMVQIMTLSNNEDAESMVVALKRQGYIVAVNHDPLDLLLHLEVGPFANKSDAEAMRHRLVLDGYNAVIR